MSRALTSALGSTGIEPTDEQAMWRVQMQDDPHAFAELVRRWQPPIRNLCARMLGDIHRAEDLAQEAFARVFVHRKNYQPSGRFSTFLWRIALNLCYDELRRLGRRPEVRLDANPEGESEPVVEAADSSPAPDAQMMDRERAEIVRQALLRLPEAYRSVVVLRHYENLKFREIAEVLEIPEGTVKSRMVEALDQLGRALQRQMPQPSGASERASSSL